MRGIDPDRLYHLVRPALAQSYNLTVTTSSQPGSTREGPVGAGLSRDKATNRSGCSQIRGTSSVIRVHLRASAVLQIFSLSVRRRLEPRAAPLPSSSLPINKLNTPVRTEHFGAHDKYNKHLWTEIHARNRG